MVRTTIQLTGEVKGYLDIKEGTAFPIVFSGSDVRDLSQRTGNTSKNVKLADTPNNNKLLGFYFDVNAASGAFDINKITPCIILQNGVPIMDNAVMQLINVTKKAPNNNTEQGVEYEVIVKDQTANFFTKLGNSELTDLRFTELNHTYTAANVIASFSNTITDGFKYLMPYTPGNVFNLSEFRPAIYVKRYFDRIFESAGFSYEWADMNSEEVQFSKWIIPYNGEAPKLRQEQIDLLRVEAEAGAEFEFTATGNGVTGNVNAANLETDVEIVDSSGAFDNTTFDYVAPVYSLGNGSLSFQAAIEWELFLTNNEAGTVYLKDVNASTQFKKLKIKPYAALFRNGVYFGANSNLYNGGLMGAYVLNEEYELATGETVLTSGTTSINLADNLTSFGAIYNVKTGVSSQPDAGLRWKETDTTSGVDANVTLGLRIKSVNLKIVPSVSEIGYGSTIFVNDFIPKKIKQADFIKSIFTLLNIYPDIDQFNASKLILKKRDKFFDSGKEYNMTKKLAKEKDQLIQFLPSLQSKRLRLTYKPDSDDANKGYLDNVGENYGQIDFLFDNDFVRDTETKELVFSPTPVGLTNFGAVVPYINGVEPKNNIRLLFDGGELTCGSFSIVNYITPTGTVVSETATSYPHLSHFNKPVNPTLDLNFGVCDYYFYNTLGARTNNNMFNLNWRRTLHQMNTGKIFTGYFDLNEADISRLRLNDKWFILNSWWNINKIEYNANSEALTKCELISVDNEQKFKPFKTKIPFKPLKGDQLFNPVRNLVSKILRSNNVILTDAPVDVQGKNNLVNQNVKSGAIYGDGNKVSADKVLIIGDDIQAEEPGVYTPLLKFPDGSEITQETLAEIAQNFANADLTLTGNREHDLNGFYVWLKNGLGLSVDGFLGASGVISGLTLNADNAAGEVLNISQGKMRLPVTVTSTNLTLDNHYIVIATGGTDIDLPTASGLSGNSRFQYIIRNVSGASINVNAVGTEIIDMAAASTYVLPTNKTLHVVAMGTPGGEWTVINNI